MEIVDSLIALIMFCVNRRGSELHIKHFCHQTPSHARLELILKDEEYFAKKRKISC